jgi:hypothetical protein
MALMMVHGKDRFHDEPYQVASAFNGAALYPMQLIKDTRATYDAGEDGQRCEHIAFNVGMGRPMYINPKWNFVLSPTKPGGPTGYRAFKSVVRIVLTPRLGWLIGLQSGICMYIFVFSVMTLGVHALFPLLAALGVFGRRKHDVLTTSDLPFTASASAATMASDGADSSTLYDFRMPVPMMLHPYTFSSTSPKRDVKDV